MIVTASPLVLDQVSDVAFVLDGRVARQATHRALLAAKDPVGVAYRRVVSRAAGEEADTGGTRVVPAGRTASSEQADEEEVA